MVVIGLVVGLGNIWCFFYIIYENGGGVFIIFYIVVFLIVGILLFFLDFVIGYCYCVVVLFLFCCLNKYFEVFGWW